MTTAQNAIVLPTANATCRLIICTYTQHFTSKLINAPTMTNVQLDHKRYNILNLLSSYFANSH